MESAELYLRTGVELDRLMGGRDWLYKASFDKANRSTIAGKRGPGLGASLEVFKEFKQRCPNVRLITDVHEVGQVESLASVVDVVQVPAFLCRQTDLLVECGRNFSTVLVKKGQWLGPENMVGVIGKVRSGNSEASVWLCERGTQFGYDRLVVDFRSVDQLAEKFDKVFLDCTHSTQISLANGTTSGDRALAERYMLAAGIFGYSGVFAEVHPDPAMAASDGDCQIPLDRVAQLLELHDAIGQALQLR